MSSQNVNRLELPALQHDPELAARPLGMRLDLVEHLEVNLSVSLGHASVSMAELFALVPGQVLSLDREVDSPIDVVLNGKVIACGRIVAVGDRFGVELTDVAAVGDESGA